MSEKSKAGLWEAAEAKRTFGELCCTWCSNVNAGGEKLTSRFKLFPLIDV